MATLPLKQANVDSSSGPTVSQAWDLKNLWFLVIKTRTPPTLLASKGWSETALSIHSWGVCMSEGRLMVTQGEKNRNESRNVKKERNEEAETKGGNIVGEVNAEARRLGQ